MKGRRRVFEKPVARTFTIESWQDSLIDILARYKVRSPDIIKAGLMSILNTEGKLPIDILKGAIALIEPEIEDQLFILNQLKSLVKDLEVPVGNESAPRIEVKQLVSHWIQNFHVVRYIQTGDVFLIDKIAYTENPSLFEIIDDEYTDDCRNLPKFSSIAAVTKTFSNASEVGRSESL